MCLKQHPKGAARSAAPLGRRRRRRLLLLAHILYDFSYMFGCFSIFPMVFAEKIVFQGPFCPGPFSRLPKLRCPGCFFNRSTVAAPEGVDPFHVMFPVKPGAKLSELLL